MEAILTAFLMSLIAENQKCVDFDRSCNRLAIKELREKCSEVTLPLVGQHEKNCGIITIHPAWMCLKEAPNNYYVKKYEKFFNIDRKKLDL
jgi:hypothetical protein